MSDERQFLDLQFTVSTNRPGYLALYEPLSASEYVLVRLDYVESLESRILSLETRFEKLKDLSIQNLTDSTKVSGLIDDVWSLEDMAGKFETRLNELETLIKSHIPPPE